MHATTSHPGAPLTSGRPSPGQTGARDGSVIGLGAPTVSQRSTFLGFGRGFGGGGVSAEMAVPENRFAFDLSSRERIGVEETSAT